MKNKTNITRSRQLPPQDPMMRSPRVGASDEAEDDEDGCIEAISKSFFPHTEQG
jgi:hypothetical protein